MEGQVSLEGNMVEKVFTLAPQVNSRLFTTIP
jgi:hypothetical protein